MGNATQAAEIAGYAGDRNVLAWQGHHLLRNTKIRAAIDGRLKQDPGIATREERQRLLTDIARGVEQPSLNMFGAVVLGPPTTAARIKAMDLMSKMAGEQKVTVDLETKDVPKINLVIEAPAS